MRGKDYLKLPQRLDQVHEARIKKYAVHDLFTQQKKPNSKEGVLKSMPSL